MTGYRRHLIVAITALWLAGCGASPAASSEPSPGTPAPLATSHPSTSPTPSAEPSIDVPVESSPRTTAPVDPACPVDLGTDSPMVTLETPGFAFWLQLSIKEMALLADPSHALEPPVTPSDWDANLFLLGGGESRLDLSYYPIPWTQEPVVISKLRLTLEREGHDPMRLPVRLVPDAEVTGAFVDVPDVQTSGTLEIHVEWSDSCFRYRAASRTRLLIDPAASIEGCPGRRNPAFDELGATFAPPILVGPVEAELNAWIFTGKVTQLAVIDPLPPYTAFKNETATFAAGPGTTVDISSWSDRLRLWRRAGDDVAFYRRGELIRWMEGGWIHGDEPEAKVVFRTSLEESGSGFGFAVPTEPGRYAATAVFDYDAACSFGSAGFVVGIDVE